MKPVLVLTTVGSSFDAKALARELVELHLAACVNVIDRMQSIYRWQGKVEEESEQLLLIKTMDARVPELKTALLQRHPYELPEFVVVPVSETSAEYGEWLLASSR
ncbi:MAG TPA: divalent-cation tolerance protein CutA [Thermoanaerobaculia bacterium]|jgi:periplasmic divalent cation tolerance protein